ncbi:MAG TPA: sulfurtransferase TusA family protein [Bacillales bacterium]|nr:sulfurtransferase TusA family protein [Bacillales bacterium]
MEIEVNHVLDAKGLACPMPIVKAKKAIDGLEPGQVIEVQATDKGSKADMQAWARSTGHQYLGTSEEGEILKHYLRKVKPEEEKEQRNFPYTADLEELQRKMTDDQKITILDVREPAEYAFEHIPGALSVPLGKLDKHISEINQEDEIYVICRTGNRSDFAAQRLTEHGFKNVKNVIPGMIEWEGPVQKQESHNGDSE